MITTVKCPFCNKEFVPDDALRHQITDEIKAKLKSEMDLDMIDLKKQIQEKNEKLESFRDEELKLREKSRKLEEREKELVLETQRRLDEEKRKVEEETTKKVAEEFHGQVLEKDKKIQDMMKQIEDLKRTSQQGSMQTQGEVGELELERRLKELFPFDEITEVKKGELGGDIRQIVKTQNGSVCGLILWERKRTKMWKEEWVGKLKEDVRRDKAQVGIILTDILPKNFNKVFGGYNGVYLVTDEFVETIAEFIREKLYELAKNKAISANKQSKAEEIYDFITSGDFNQQVEKMSESYFAMKNQITKEKVAYEKLWKERELQIDNFLKGISNIYGGLKEIAGSALPQVKNLELE